MQCLLYAPWRPGQLITQRITGVKIREENHSKSEKQLRKWHLSSGYQNFLQHQNFCFKSILPLFLTFVSSEFDIAGENGVRTYKMATYEWFGYEHPLTNKLTRDGNGTTYSFLEDWNTSPKADGHLYQRSVFYINPS